MLASGTAGYAGANPTIVVEAVLSGTIQPLVSPGLEAEYFRVLSDPRVARRHGLDSEQMREYLEGFLGGAVTDTPLTHVQPCPDPTDQMLWDLLAAWPTAILVTGDRLLEQSGHFPGRVLSPREFCERYLDS